MRSALVARAARLTLILLLVIVTGEAGHLIFDQFGAEVAHHLFHILFPLAAAAVFGVFVGRDVRRHGWPTFSWRL